MDGQAMHESRDALGTAVIEPPRAAPVGGPAWHDQVYRAAAGELVKVPWAEGKPAAAVVSWLNAEAPGRVRPGSRAVVIGCGLGDDVIELINRGYDAIGFDISPTAVEWARRRFKDYGAAFSVCDLLRVPTRFHHRFELVVEAYTLQSIEPAMREQAAAAMAAMLGPRGVLVAVANGRDESDLVESIKGPPWALTRAELAGLMEASGLKPVRAIDDFSDDGVPPRRRLRGAFEHA